MSIYGNYIAKLIEEFSRLPGIGGKSATRIAFSIINMDKERAYALAKAIVDAKENVVYCSTCQAITDQNPCAICDGTKRDVSTIMVVEDSRDMAAYERTKEYKGLYHVLHGAISPMAGVSPDDLRVKELLSRLQTGDVQEVIIATNPNVEGEATAMYLGRLLKGIGVMTTRIAHGVPVGGDLEYVDEVTLARALEGRREIG